MERGKYTLPLLTNGLLEEIIFAMEDQNTQCCLDLKTGTIAVAENLSGDVRIEEGRLLDLPTWTSSQGFHLMERFAGRVRNPYYSRKLRRVLQQGHGVFRSFKNVLEEVPILKSEWYGFKQHEMEKVVTRWYREKQGHEALEATDGEEGDDGLDDLLLEDFSISFSTDGTLGEALTLRLLSDMTSEEREMLSSERDGCRYVYASDPQGEVCGLLVFIVRTDRAYVRFYGVEAKWRGLGLFRLLFDSFSRQMARERVASIVMDFCGKDREVASMFRFLPVTELYRRISLPVSQYVWESRNSEKAFL